MQEELSQIVSSRDLIVLTSSEEAAVSWFIEQYKGKQSIQIIEDAYQLESTEILELCRTGLDEGNKVILVAQYRSQLPVIQIAALCRPLRKSLVNINLVGWDEDNKEPNSYSSF